MGFLTRAAQAPQACDHLWLWGGLSVLLILQLQWNLTKLNGVNAIIQKWHISAHYFFWSSLLHVIDGACVVHASQSTLAAVHFAASPHCGFLRSYLVSFLPWPRRSFPQVPLPFRPPRRQGCLQVSCRCVWSPFYGLGHVGMAQSLSFGRHAGLVVRGCSQLGSFFYFYRINQMEPPRGRRTLGSPQGQHALGSPRGESFPQLP